MTLPEILTAAWLKGPGHPALTLARQEEAFVGPGSVATRTHHGPATYSRGLTVPGLLAWALEGLRESGRRQPRISAEGPACPALSARRLFESCRKVN